jgi:hypothetical protein
MKLPSATWASDVEVVPEAEAFVAHDAWSQHSGDSGRIQTQASSRGLTILSSSITTEGDTLPPWKLQRVFSLIPKASKMTITRIGTNAKYSTGWDAAFSKGKKSKKAAPAASKKKAPAKKAKKGRK